MLAASFHAFDKFFPTPQLTADQVELNCRKKNQWKIENEIGFLKGETSVW